MIAQLLGLDHRDRVSSLGLIMTTPGGRRFALPKPSAVKMLLTPLPTKREGYAEAVAAVMGVIGSPGFPPDPARVRELALRAWDRGRNPAGAARQLHAVTSAPSRLKRLAGLDLPTVVIHGDADPLVLPRAGRALAAAIPAARLELIEGMAHDLPSALFERIGAALIDNATRPESNNP